MTKRMLIDATHAEETRVVVLDGNRLEDFDVETSTKRQLKGNIYLAKVVRVEPSLQAAFVEYGGNRHGFLAFSEIHPDYYQIPVADRQRLLEMEAEDARLEEEEAERELAQQAPATERLPIVEEEPAEYPITAAGPPPEPLMSEPALQAVAAEHEPIEAPHEAIAETPAADAEAVPEAITASPAPDEPEAVTGAPVAETTEAAPEAPKPEALPAEPSADAPPSDRDSQPPRRAQPMIIESETISGPIEAGDAETDDGPAGSAESNFSEPVEAEDRLATVEPDVREPAEGPQASANERDMSENGDELEQDDFIPESPPPETVGGEAEAADEPRERRMPPRFMRNYKIQEVIHRRQILLVQVVKEERGTKGAALTTYLSLAGRFSVLMPNSPRGGGISRKITSATDRRRLKEVMAELDIPKGMGLIVRTAGANRPKAEIKRDCEYLLRLWDDIREHTLKSIAPALIYEEASLIKRAIRDVYSRDIDEIWVDGETGWRSAHEFMRMLMPSHAKKVQLWRDLSQPLFARYQVEAQLDAMMLPTAQLRSGGYLVINQAEALVAIDVNSGRSTRERGIEETALRTNLEAADEVARQLRLRDLAGLIVIDFIDMELKKHNAMVERRLKEALKNDRARIQVGHISHFGLMEMSRQRLRPSLAETSFITCQHCAGTGHVRSTESAAIHVLRGIEEEGGKRRSAEIVVHVTTPIALYILNHKRDRLIEIENRYAMRVTIAGDDAQIMPQYRIDRVRAQAIREAAPVITPDAQPIVVPIAEVEPEDEEEIVADDDTEEAESEDADDGVRTEASEAIDRRRRRRRRRRGGRPGEARPSEAAPSATEDEALHGSGEAPDDMHIEGVPEHIEPGAEEALAADSEASGEAGAGRLRRGRRGGRRRGRRDGETEVLPVAVPGADQPDLPTVYIGPTPANPFGGQAFDIFDVLEQAEASAGAWSEPAAPAIQTASAPEPATGVDWPGTEQETALAPGLEPAELPESPSTEGEIRNAGAPEPSAEVSAAPRVIPGEASTIETAAAAAPAAEMPVLAASAPLGAENDVAREPAIKPILVGAEEEPLPKKRGWWRR